jgi:ABC-type Fe3+/spermidine/putrescine transport system ATPase subunit
MNRTESVGKPIRFDRASKVYGRVEALAPTDLTVGAGEFLTLLGPSGSGKSTLLNLAAGYLEPSSGRIWIGERDVTGVPARHRNIGMVFQNYALFPHMTVAENVGYGLKVRRVPRQEIARRVSEALELVQLSGMEGRGIGQLSGGQQQRVALARALVIEPDVLLMDEPLGALDRQLRKAVQLEIRRLHAAHRRTTIYVTHDQEEALVMSDRIGLMRNGRIVQIGTAAELYDRPANTFVASFLGESNLLAGTVEELSEGAARLRVSGLDLLIDGTASPGLRPGTTAAALIRPENVRLDESDGVPARIKEVVYLGELIAVRLELVDGTTLWCRRFAREGLPGDESVRVAWNREDVRILPEA